MKNIIATDFEINTNAVSKPITFSYVLTYMIAGAYFGVVLVKAEVLSWFRIQEMFRLQSFHMFGTIGSAVVTGMMAVWFLKKFKVKSVDKEPIHVTEKKFHKGVVAGGLLFGIGWALTGACPGPIFAQIGLGYGTSVVMLLSAIAGTYVYGLMRNKLPH